MRIAVLHDDPLVPEMLRGTLENHHYVCHFYPSSGALLKDARHRSFDLVIADWHLCDTDGSEALSIARLRAMGGGPQLPVLLVARPHEALGVAGALHHGAVDFMTRPLRPGELVARVSALLRRAHPQAMGEQRDFGPYRFDAEKRQLSLRGVVLALKNREYELALFMFRNAGRLLSRAHLREVVWGELSEAPSRSLDTHVSRLRAKLQLTPANGYTITAVYGMGYRLDAVHAGDPGSSEVRPQG